MEFQSKLFSHPWPPIRITQASPFFAPTHLIITRIETDGRHTSLWLSIWRASRPLQEPGPVQDYWKRFKWEASAARLSALVHARTNRYMEWADVWRNTKGIWGCQRSVIDKAHQSWFLFTLKLGSSEDRLGAETLHHCVWHREMEQEQEIQSDNSFIASTKFKSF